MNRYSLQQSGNVFPDGLTRRRCRAGSVEHVQRVLACYDVEILNQFACGCHGLSADAGAARLKIIGPDIRNKPLQRATKTIFAERLGKLSADHRRVTAKETPQAGEGQRVREVTEVNRGARVTFARERENCVWPGFNAAANEPGEMDAQEWKLGIG